MRVQLTTPFAELSFDLSTEAAETLVKAAFRLSNTSNPTQAEGQASQETDMPGEDSTNANMPIRDTHEALAEQPPAEERSDAWQPQRKNVAAFALERPEDRTRYRGFLLIQCEHCGQRKSFNANSPIDTFRCEKCHQYTPLRNLTPVFAECECGKHWKYRTNETADLLEINCLECGSPISLAFNARKKVYATIRR